jgi:hypothetical protein
MIKSTKVRNRTFWKSAKSYFLEKYEIVLLGKVRRKFCGKQKYA